MENETETRINKDLILREKLAVEKTEMANDRTFLSFARLPYTLLLRECQSTVC